ncbi:MAG: hypothetical protein H6622_11495 [Halobacteriovoraceae bacterium]|nr:hypothetical protein [Halobacteriovoraceae bacterium]
MLNVESLEKPIVLDGQWAFTRDDKDENYKVINDSTWVAANPLLPWDLIYSDSINFKVGWYQKKVKFHPSLIGKDIILLLDTYLAKMKVYLDNDLIYQRTGKSREGDVPYYALQAVPIKFRISKNVHLISFRIDTILMRGAYQRPFELRDINSYPDASDIFLNIFKAKMRFTLSWVFLAFSLFFFMIFIRTRQNEYFVATLMCSGAFPFYYFPAEIPVSLFDPEKLTILHYLGMVFMAPAQSLFVQAYSKMTKKFNYFMGITSIILIILIMFLSLNFNLDVFLVVRKITFFFMVIIIFHAISLASSMIILNQKYCWILFSSILVYALCALNDIFLAMGILRGHSYIFIGSVVGVGTMNFMAVDDFVRKYFQNKKYLKEVQDLNQNLEQKVIQRTFDLDKSNKELKILFRSMNEMVNSLDDGFLVIEKDFKCHETYSENCLKLIGFDPKDYFLWDILGVYDKNEKEEIEQWLNLFFESNVDFQNLTAVSPNFKNSANDLRVIEIDFRPIYSGNSNQHVALVVIISDKTELIEKEKKAKELKDESMRIINIAMHKNEVQLFFKEIKNFILKGEEWLRSKTSIPSISLHERLHTLKGGAQTLSLSDLANTIHELEIEVKKSDTVEREFLIIILSILKEWKSNFKITNKDLLGENFDSEVEFREITLFDLEGFYKKLTLKENIEIADIFKRNFLYTSIAKELKFLEKTADELSKRFDKPLERVKFLGDENIKICPEPYKEIFKTFVHILRNMIDHGIEDSETRKICHKPLEGSVKIDWKLEDNVIHFYFQDDGRGINIEKLREKSEQGKKLTDSELLQSIFEPNMSSKERVELTSGLGMGLYIVKKNVELLNGRISVESENGIGTTFHIELPYIEKVF